MLRLLGLEGCWRRNARLITVGEFRGVIGILGADSVGGCCRAIGLGEGVRVGGRCRAIELVRDSRGIRVGRDIEDL